MRWGEEDQGEGGWGLGEGKRGKKEDKGRGCEVDGAPGVGPSLSGVVFPRVPI